MDLPLQFYYCDPTNFTLNDTFQNPMKNLLVLPILDQNEFYLKEVTFYGRKSYMCTFSGCGKIYRYKSEFMRHELVHTQQKPLSCPFADCSKTFKRDDVLRNHIRIHTGEAPFKCKEPGCGKSFSSRAGLKYHRLKHNGQKEYRCSFPDCNKMFLTLPQLKQHEGALQYHKRMLLQNLSTIDISNKHYGDSNALSLNFQEKLELRAKFRNDIGKDQKTYEDLNEEFKRIANILYNTNNA